MKANFKNIEAIAFDFDGVFTNNEVVVNEKGIESVICNRSDGIGLSKLKGLGIHIVIISTETNPVVSSRAKKLGVQVIQGVSDKDQAILAWAKDVGVRPINIAFVGNDINDLPALMVVGYPIGVADAFEEVRNAVIFLTETKGGHGAVREICDLVVESKLNSGSVSSLDTALPTAKDMGERVWGEELLLAIAPGRVMMKKLTVKAGCKGGLQYHRKRFEMGYVVSGRMIVRIGDGDVIKELILKTGDHFFFPPYLVHQEEAIEDTIIIECSNTWTNDRVRVEDQFGYPGGEIGLRSSLPGEEILL